MMMQRNSKQRQLVLVKLYYKKETGGYYGSLQM